MPPNGLILIICCDILKKKKLFQILIYRLVGLCHIESFRPPFSKGGADPTRGALVASAEAKLLYPSKAPRRGECQAEGLAEGEHTSGGSPLSHKAFSNRLSAFSFGRRSAKWKLASLRFAANHKWFALSKKKSACRKFRACERDQRSARWISGRFLKKATEKLSNWLRH